MEVPRQPKAPSTATDRPQPPRAAAPTTTAPKDITQIDPEEEAWSTSKYPLSAPQITTSTAAASQDEEDDDPGDQDDHDQEGNPVLLPPPKPPSFAPFYALILDPRTTSHAHPTVHYIFADDDDADVLTDALLRSADASSSRSRDPHSNPQSSAADVEERVVIIDFAADGKEVVSAVSLSAEWQGLRTSVSAAPSWQGAGGGDGGGGSAEGTTGTTGKVAMLRIWGEEEEEEARGGKVKTTTTMGTMGLGIGEEGGRRRRGAGDVDGLMRMFGAGLRGLEGVLGGVEEGDVDDGGDGDDGDDVDGPGQAEGGEKSA
jgi:hypothetical protein